ncbi:MAG: diguanylate cyclase [Candidatus Hydrogenedentes bacterium]|nr:diguanylate cyclase [Candidatus Hydrogenedentota bacterium]
MEHGSSGPAPPPATMSYKDARILVAEDQNGVAVLIQRMVESRLGSEIVVVGDGDDALARLRAESFDVFVTDMMMPGTHGLELVRVARAARPETAIIVMTGYPREFPYVEAIQAGAQDFINKPFPALELEAKLIRIFKEQALHRDLRVAESKYRSLFELSSEGMLLLETKTHRIADVNHSFSELCGRPADSLVGLHVQELFDAPEHQRLEQVLEFCATYGKCAVSDLTLYHSNGRRLLVDINITHIKDAFNSFVFMGFRDMTEKREVEQRLADVAQKDELTGLYNRRSFTNRIEGAILRAREREEPLALVLIDLDNFKACNDTYGHQVGDQMLTHVGEVLRGSTRQHSFDKGFRCGGDEFAMILQDIDPDRVIQVAERLQRLYSERETYGTTMSIGIACFNGEANSEALIQRADRALYRAKGQGKNAIHVA